MWPWLGVDVCDFVPQGPQRISLQEGGVRNWGNVGATLRGLGAWGNRPKYRWLDVILLHWGFELVNLVG